jgi:hypothetical protein
MPRKPPDMDHAEWISAVRAALDMTQTKFGELLDAGGEEGGARDVVAKWEGGVEPKFGYTRRLVYVAPPPLLLKFLGRSAESAGLSDPRSTVASVANETERDVMTPEGITVGKELDEIDDLDLRKRARTAALAAIDAERAKSHPSGAGAERSTGNRARSK